MATSKFIKAMHPKTEIEPTRAAIVKVLKAGWWGQMKIHGHRAQIHVPAEVSDDVQVFNRQGRPHAKILPAAIEAEVRRLFQPKTGHNVIDAEWLKGDDRLFAFDFLCHEGKTLDRKTYEERFELLPRVYASTHLETLKIFKTVDACLKVLEDPAPHIEGLVFKAPFVRGFADSAIVRCRKPGQN